MPQRNIYVKEEDQEVFEKAKGVLESESLSKAVVEALKHYIKDKESGKESKYGRFKRERVPIGRMPRGDTPDRWIEFTGRMLARYRKDENLKNPEVQSAQYVVYQGSMGGFLLTYKLVYPSPPDVRERSETDYVVGKSVERLKMESDQIGWEVPVTLLDEAKDELGGQIIEKPLMELEMDK